MQPRINIDRVRSPSSKSFIWPYLFMTLNYLYSIKNLSNVIELTKILDLHVEVKYTFVMCLK